MAKTITLNYEGRSYTLEFTRATVKMIERSGVKISDIDDKPMTVLPELFAGAFLANHRYVKRSLIDEIFDGIGNKIELISKLTEMYNEPLETLLEDSEGNAEWGANW